MAVEFDFSKMFDAIKEKVSVVEGYLGQLERASGGAVQIEMMFKLQFHMQLMSQAMETFSQCLGCVHNEMMTMARKSGGGGG